VCRMALADGDDFCLIVSTRSLQEIDLTGQICADSIGVNIYSGIGGQMDFIRGAALSDGGKVMKESSVGLEVRHRRSHSLPSLVAMEYSPSSRCRRGRTRAEHASCPPSRRARASSRRGTRTRAGDARRAMHCFNNCESIVFLATYCRAHAHWVVTEHGAVNLFGKPLRERARLLISIAHPEDRPALYDAAVKRYGPSFKLEASAL